jgi:predicted SAM-dependent methyltransferase
MTTELLVNLGCGSRIHPAWCNLDLHASVPGVTECDLTKGIPLPNGSAKAVYSAAVLEHIRRPDVAGFLSEICRVLQPGGWLRIAVPDFEKQVNAYQDALRRAMAGEPGAAEDREWMIIEIADQLGRDCSGGAMAAYFADGGPTNLAFVCNRIGGEGRQLARDLADRDFSSSPDLRKSRQNQVRGRGIGRWLLKLLLRSKDLESDLAALEVGRFRLFSGEVHQWVYDQWSLRKLLEANGFASLQVKQHGISEIPEWRRFNLEIDVDGVIQKPDLLIVEGRKVST